MALLEWTAPYRALAAPLMFLTFSLVVALPPLFLHILLHPLTYLPSPSRPASYQFAALRSKFFYYSWRYLSPLADPNDAPKKRPLLAQARGTVLEVGPGVGDNIKYYNRSSVDRLILVEPNVNMHPDLLKKANAAGFSVDDSSLQLLGCGGAASDETALAAAGVTFDSVDTVAAIHVLCGIPQPAHAIEMYRRFLKKGGLLLFYEHVRSEESITAYMQSFITRWIWTQTADGCCLDRPTGAWILGGPDAAKGEALVTGLEMVNEAGKADGLVGRRWSKVEIKRPADHQRFSCIPHIMGWAVKA
ncbi:hypothetical protein FH972_023992 [Carpinus fangiana]|uniref:Methyltransferase type 11 domain-containing protein n=1 Tax=Carpinus fangiana TaxID=176857 RepID=A0A5N6KZ85_9ROSI|nr:hypothetical protein FH972_023992 [Carpinus fangiana]